MSCVTFTRTTWFALGLAWIAASIAGCGLLGSMPTDVAGAPKIVQELVALAPAGSKVTVTHTDDDPFGSYHAFWGWSFVADDPTSAVATYRTWFTEQGIPLSTTDVNDQPLSPTDVLVSVPGVSLWITVPPIRVDGEPTVVDGELSSQVVELPGDTVTGTIADTSITADGELLR